MSTDLRVVYRRRVKQFFFAYVAFVGLLFFGCLVLYPFFSIPLPLKLVIYLNALTFLLFLLCVSISLFLKRRFFPIVADKDPYWSYTATRRYFWMFVLASLPFFISFILYIVFASLSNLVLAYLLSMLNLYLLRPKEEDLS
ncbi:hypothetical protein [Thermocrinis minervae]|uniref:hypothetical protein n=1 Tax=Thermocrinis minervae TaxID=381751 RepID=UPI0009A75E3E|nr:hypothetical protein [Thermocrinis minervae]